MPLKINAAEVLENVNNWPIVYIAGQVTGLPYNEVWTKFKAKQLELEAQEFHVINPLEHLDEKCEWKEAMRSCIMLLMNADFICLLPDWHKSKGATMERMLSIQLGIPSIDQ